MDAIIHSPDISAVLAAGPTRFLEDIQPLITASSLNGWIGFALAIALAFAFNFSVLVLLTKWRGRGSRERAFPLLLAKSSVFLSANILSVCFVSFVGYWLLSVYAA